MMPETSSRRALLTGVTGFIGGRLASRLLASGWHVDAIVRPGSDIASLPFASSVTFHVVHDGEDLTPVLTTARADVVFHLASLYLADHRPDQIQDLVESNVLFPALLAEAMVATGTTRLINTGTAWQHFNGADYLPVNLYAATKQAAEDLLRYYVDARRLSVVTLRLFDTYGPGDKRRKLIQILIDAAMSGDTLAISPGEQIVDLTHVDDVTAAFVIAGERLLTSAMPLQEEWFVSAERQTVRSLVGKVEDILGAKIDAQFGGRPYRPREVMMPIDPVGRVIPGWHPERNLTTSLHQMADR